MAGVWQTADPMSMLVVSNPEAVGCLAMPRQASPPGYPDPMPEPMAPKPMQIPAPSRAAHVGEGGAFPKSRNMSMRAMTIEKMAGVWQTADPMSMLVVSRPETVGCMEIPRQALPPGYPEPMPEPTAPRPMERPAPSRAAAFTKLVPEVSRKMRRIAMTKAKMPADSAIACPTSMFLMISPDFLGSLDMLWFARPAVNPSPRAAPIAPNPIQKPAPT